MMRLAATVGLDVRNQFRQGFYAASIVVVGVLVGIASWLPPAAVAILPAILLTNMAIATFVFFGGLVLLEKGEGTLESSIVSPLRPSEYLAAKVLTLGGLGVVENLVIAAAVVAFGWTAHMNWGWILVASLLTGALYTTLGFLTVIRYDSINDYLFPMILGVLFLEIPGLVCFGMPESKMLFVLPTYGLLWLFRAALEPVPLGVLIYGVVYPTVWLVSAFLLGQRALRRYVAGQMGHTS